MNTTFGESYNIINRPADMNTLGESLTRNIVKCEKSKAAAKISRVLGQWDMGKGKQTLNAIYRRGNKMIKNAYGDRLLWAHRHGEGKKRSTSFLIMHPEDDSNYIRWNYLTFKPPTLCNSDERFLFEVTSHALERLLATKLDQKEWLLDIFNQSTQLFAPTGRIMSDSLSRQLPSTFHHWVAGKGESRCVVEVDEGGRPFIKLVTFIPEKALRGWSLAQSSNATIAKNSYQLKRQKCSNF